MNSEPSTTNRSIATGIVGMAAAILVFLLLVDKLVFFAAKAVLAQSDMQSIKIYQQPVDAKIVAVGNSRAGVHFDESFGPNGIKLLNLGGGGVGYRVAEVLVRDVVERNPNIKYVFIETYFLDSGAIGRENGAVENVFSPRMENLIREVVGPQETFFRKWFWTLRLNENNFVGAVKRVISEDELPRAMNAVFPKAMQEQVKKRKPTKLLMLYKEELASLVIDMRKAGVELVLVTTPMHPLGRGTFSNEDMFIAELNAFARRHGIRHFNYLYLLNLDEHHADSIHLNRVGQSLFEDEFAKDLRPNTQR